MYGKGSYITVNLAPNGKKSPRNASEVYPEDQTTSNQNSAQ